MLQLLWKASRKEKHSVYPSSYHATTGIYCKTTGDQYTQFTRTKTYASLSYCFILAMSLILAIGLRRQRASQEQYQLGIIPLLQS